VHSIWDHPNSITLAAPEPLFFRYEIHNFRKDMEV
jgi:hypothetical protein